MSLASISNISRRSRSPGAEVYIKSNAKRAEVALLFWDTWGLRAARERITAGRCSINVSLFLQVLRVT